MSLSSLTALAAALPQETDGAVGGAVAIVAVLVYVVMIAVGYAITALGYAGVFKKAGEPGWAGWVPIYNTIVLLKIVGRPAWWAALWYLVPIANVVVMILAMVDLSRSFGHDIGFALGLIFLTVIFMWVIWLGESQYRGPAALAGGYAPGGPGGYGGYPQGYPAPGQAQGFAAPQPGYAQPQTGYAQPQTGYPQPSASPQPQTGYPQPSASPQPQPGYPQPPVAPQPQPGYPPQPGYAQPQPGYPPQPGSGQPGYPGQQYPGQPS